MEASKEDVKIQLGLRLKDLRAERGLSQDAFALSINMARTYYAEVEVGKRNVSLVNIRKIADGFGISISELFDSPVFTRPPHSPGKHADYAYVKVNSSD